MKHRYQVSVAEFLVVVNAVNIARATNGWVVAIGFAGLAVAFSYRHLALLHAHRDDQATLAKAHVVEILDTLDDDVKLRRRQIRLQIEQLQNKESNDA